MPLGGAQQRISFDNSTLLAESRTRPEPERRREADEGERSVRGMGGRLPRRSGLSGYSSPRGGERAGSAEGDALTSPSRSTTAKGTIHQSLNEGAAPARVLVVRLKER